VACYRGEGAGNYINPGSNDLEANAPLSYFARSLFRNMLYTSGPWLFVNARDEPNVEPVRC